MRSKYLKWVKVSPSRRKIFLCLPEEAEADNLGSEVEIKVVGVVRYDLLPRGGGHIVHIVGEGMMRNAGISQKSKQSLRNHNVLTMRSATRANADI